MAAVQGARSRGGTASTSGPAIPMERVQDRAQSLLTKGVAANSLQTYTRAVQLFDQFRSSYRIPRVWPAQHTHFVHFMAQLRAVVI